MAWFEQGAKGKRLGGKEIERWEASHRAGRFGCEVPEASDE